MFTYKFVVREDKSNSLRLRLRFKGRVTEIALGLSVAPDVLKEVLSGECDRSNLKLKRLLGTYDSRLSDLKFNLMSAGGRDLDLDGIRDLVLTECLGREPTAPTGDKLFVTTFNRFVESKTNRGTISVYQHTLDRMRLFDPDVDKRSFEDIDLKWLTDFEVFCAQTASKNARNIHLRNIRAVFNYAIDFDLTSAYPFRRFKIRPEATRKRSMSVEELRELFTFPVEPYAEIYRDLFKLIFMLIGINTVDLHGLKSVTKNGRIEYKRAKTGRLYSVKVEPEAMEIIEKYRGVNGLLCIADRWSDSRNFRHQMNKALQRIGEVERKGRGGKKIIEPAFPGLTTYWARHTWATIARKLKISVDDIALALGHSNGHETTRIYIDEDLEAIDAANRRVLDWVLYGEDS